MVSCDWSSDVCSSDLRLGAEGHGGTREYAQHRREPHTAPERHDVSTDPSDRDSRARRRAERRRRPAATRSASLCRASPSPAGPCRRRGADSPRWIRPREWTSLWPSWVRVSAPAGERPRAFVVRSGSVMADLDEEELRDSIDDQVESRLHETHWLNGRIDFLPDIPKSQNGKVLRRELRVMIATK